MIATVRRDDCERGDHESEWQLFFQNFLKEGEVGDWAEIVEVAGVSTGFLENRGYCREEWIIAAIRGVRD